MNGDKLKALEQALAGDYANITGIVALKDGQLAYERYADGFAEGDAIHLYSVTKSVFSALIGIAIDRGYIKGVRQRVLEFFPDCAPGPGDEAVRNIALSDILTMTAPYKFETEPYEAFFESDDWVRFALDQLGGAADGAFRYAPIVGAHILSGVLANATGQPIRKFAEECLFGPLGIGALDDVPLPTREAHFAFYEKPRHLRGWVVDPQGLSAASWGLALTPRDMAKLGQLYASRGMWRGGRVVPEAWVRESTRVHSLMGDLSYGYLWWVLGDGAFAALGDGGNAIYVKPKDQLVVAVAGLFMPGAKDSVRLIQAYIEPMLWD